MKAEVQMVNEKGRGVPARERGAMPKYRGILRIHEVRSQELGRMTPTAHLVSATDSVELPAVPALHDAAVLFLNNGQMRIRGFEFIEGVQFGQTWDVKVS